MQMFVAHTYELDDAQAAVDEILQALPLDSMAGKNAVGILTVQMDAVENGVVKALSDALPFDVIGMTAFASSGGQEVDLSMISLVVLVSETLTFTTGITSDLSQSYKEELDTLYTQVSGAAPEKPALGLVYSSFLRHTTGHELLSYLTKISDNMPIFGALASDYTYFCDDAYVFCNGKIYNRALALLCISGPVKAHFLYSSLPVDGLQDKEAIITASEDNVVFTVNDMPVANYLYSLGFSTEVLADSGSEVPFLVDYRDGTPIQARELIGVTSEKHVFFGGNMPTGAALYISSQTAEGVLQTTQSLLQYIENKKDDLLGALVINCSERTVVLGSDPLREAKEALAMFAGKIPYHHCYVRGEICPAFTDDGQMQNRFHNFTIIACLFEKLDVLN